MEAKKVAAIGATLGFLCAAVQLAWATDPNLSLQLGTVLGSEEFCGLAYDQGAIRSFIEKQVSPDDMSFASELDLMTSGVQFTNKSMSASEKTARCTQVRRVAKSLGFIE